MKCAQFGWILALATGCITTGEIEDRKDALADVDNDGYKSVEYGGGDCDDDDKAIHPGATETPYDGVDNDCSDATPDDDLDGDQYDNDIDCDDENAEVNPGMKEVCDEVDNNCSGENNEPGAENEIIWYADIDNDGYGDINSPLSACDRPSGYSDNDQDCNDAESTANPDGVETCETAFDDDCNGETNEVDAPSCIPYFVDMDEDGYGITSYNCLCEPKDNYTALEGTDCDDGDDSISPAGMEILDDTHDSDCDGDIDRFRFERIDSRSSLDAIGPRIRASGDSFYVAWLAEEFNQGTGTEFDGGMIAEFDAEDTQAGEIDFFGFGTTSNTESLAPKFEFLMNEDYWMIGRGGVNGTSRSLTVNLVDRSSQTLSAYTESVATSDTWDDIQAGYTASGSFTLVACGLGTTGVQVLQASIPALLQGTNVFSQNLAWSADICEYNDSTGSFYMGDSGAATMDYFGWFPDDSEFQIYLNQPNIEVTDIEVTRNTTSYFTALTYDMSGKSYLVLWTKDGTPQTIATGIRSVDNDIAVSPNEGSVACVVASNGDLNLYYVDLSTNQSITSVALDPGVPVDECAIAATNSGKVALAFRSGDNLYIGFAEYP